MEKWIERLREGDLKGIGKICAIGAVGIGCIAGLLYFGKAIVVNGVIMGVLTVAGIGILWLKSPVFIKKGLAKGDLLFDILFTVFIFAAFGLTVTGLIGAGVTCIFMSILLRVNKFLQNKKEAE
jgi:hypothetical protein